MAENEAITDEMKSWIGKVGKPHEMPMEKIMVRRFAQAIDDPNPLWQDEEYAKKSRFGRLVVPPTILVTSMVSGTGADRPMPPHSYLRGLDGGATWDFYQPIMVGDVITSQSKLADITSREGKMGTMVYFTWETRHTNQNNELVAKTTSTAIMY